MKNIASMAEMCGSADRLSRLFSKIFQNEPVEPYGETGGAGGSVDPGADESGHGGFDPGWDGFGETDEPGGDGREVSPEGQPAEAPPDPNAPQQGLQPGQQQETVESLQAKMAEMQAAFDQQQQVVDWYANEYNQRMAQQRHTPGGQQPQVPGQYQNPAPPAQAGQGLPDGITQPAEWKNADDAAAWTQHTANQIAQQRIQDTVGPIVESFNRVVTAMQEQIVRSQFSDFDELSKAALNDLLTFDPQGNVVGEKNPGMLAYIRSQPLPQKALAEHGQKLLAPGKTKQNIQENTRRAVASIGKKPTGPKNPGQAAAKDQPAELDWNTPPKQAADILYKRGVLG